MAADPPIAKPSMPLSGPQPRLLRRADGTLRLAAPAKINLNLLVGPRREDGFHELDSIVAKVTLYDVVTLAPRDDGQITLHCTGADCGPDAENLALRATHRLAEGRDVPGASITLAKHIPPAGGLGGGSSDAAAVLWGLNKLWRLDLDPLALAELAEQLGSDVPLFLGPAAARMTGRGEKLEPLGVHPFWAVLYLPAIPCPTEQVYAAYDRRPREAPKPVAAAVLARPPSQWRGRMVNQLAAAAREVSTEFAAAHDRLRDALPVAVSMTGSGSALFALCDNLREALAVFAAVPPDMRDACRVVVGNDW